MTTLQQIIADTGNATKAVFGLNDDQGNGMGCLKVIQDSDGKGYLAVYGYGNAQIGVATSADLINWHYRADVDSQATQPYITALTDGGYLVADEYNNGAPLPGGGGHVRLVYFASRAAILAGNQGHSITLPRTLSPCNEGTPNIYSVQLQPDILHSTIAVGHHYHRGCDVDRQATGVLKNFKTWTTAPQDTVNNAVIAAADAVGATLGGNIGARDYFWYQGHRYNLIEGQYTKGDFSTWNVYLYHWATRSAEEIEMTQSSGTIGSVGNPRATVLTGPDGKAALVVTFFGFDPQVGPILYYRTLV
jgi:hypothetical protein